MMMKSTVAVQESKQFICVKQTVGRVGFCRFVTVIELGIIQLNLGIDHKIIGNQFSYFCNQYIDATCEEVLYVDFFGFG